MKADSRRLVLFSAIGLLALGVSSVQSWATDEPLSSELAAAKKWAAEETHLLRYKFTAGESITWKVRHLGTTEATVRGNTQTSKMRALSTKQWQVTDVDDEGNTTFVYSVANVDMWQKISGRPEVSYNSETDKTPPREYLQVAKSVGVPIATVKVSPSGKVIERDKAPVQANSGLGEIIMPLPVEPVKAGESWHVANEIRVRTEKNGRVERIKTRLVYTLQAVKTGVATISVRTEIVTPVDDPSIKSQLVQQLTNGEVKFDVDAGRVLSQHVDWDETVVGFSGDDSLMKYLARFTEELVTADATAEKPAEAEIR